jgi:hypothetical protein
MSEDRSFNRARRRFLQLFGFGAASALGAVVVSDNLFAKQFAGEAAPVDLPKMVYDPELQMMVDPATRRPIYLDSQKVATINATVTAGCATCPKCDDSCG